MIADPSAMSFMGGWLLVFLGCAVGLDYMGRLRKVPASKSSYRISWLVFGGVLLGGGMWASHFLWSNALYGGFDSSTDFAMLLGLIVSCIGAVALLWVCSGVLTSTLASLAAGLLVFFSVLSMSHLWSLGHVLETPPPPAALMLPTITLAIGVVLIRTSWRFPRSRSNKWPRLGAAMSILGLSLAGYGSFQVSYILTGAPVDGHYEPIASTIVFLHGLVVLVAGGVISFFEKRFTTVLDTYQKTERELRDSKNQAKAIVGTAFDAFISIDEGGVIRDWNEQATKLLGWEAADMIGRQWETLEWDHAGCIPSKTDKEHVHRRVEGVVSNKEGRQFPVEVSIWTSEVAGDRRINAFLHDISDRKMAARRLSAQTMAAEALLEAKTIPEVSARILPAICMALEWPVGTLWLVDDTGNEVYCIGFWSNPDGDYQHFQNSTENIRLPIGIGIPGRVLYSAKPLWIEDVTLESNFRRANAARSSGLISGFGFPIKGPNGVLGVMEFFSHMIQPRDDQLLEMMDTVGNLFGAFLQNTRSMEELWKEQVFLSALLDNLSDGIVACDKNGVLSLFNRATREFQGIGDEPVAADEWARKFGLFQPDGKTQLDKEEVPLFRAWSGEMVRDAEIVIVTPEGAKRSVVCNGQPLMSDNGELMGAVIAIHDVSEKKEADAKLMKLAHYDTLTQLPNRSLFYNTLAKEMETARREDHGLCVMFLDLDKFKEVNDTMGHIHGDNLLQQVADRLVGNLRSGDTVGRLGGDEFAVILPGPGPAQAVAHVAEKVRRAISEPFAIGGRIVNVSTSIGITCFPHDTADIDTLVQFADQAMYAAKAAGKNQYRFYTPQMNQEAVARMETEAALRIAATDEQFFLHYQPKINLQTGVITGLEALLRWQHPKDGPTLPGSFVSILEDMGMINEVGAWALDTVCLQIEQWQKSGIDCPRVAINVSARQLSKHANDKPPSGSDDFSSVMFSLMERHPQSAMKIDLEITESSIMASSGQAYSLLEKLRSMGVGISIDDFGTGYSSLSHLKRLPVDAIKIDREFIKDAASDQEDAAIISAIINMSHSLGLRVIAEGVETEAQLQFLIEHGCDEVQGYLIAMPFGPEALGPFLDGFPTAQSVSDAMLADTH